MGQKVRLQGVRGFPDLYIPPGPVVDFEIAELGPGVAYPRPEIWLPPTHIEIKVEGKKPTGLQHWWLSRLASLGCVTGWGRDVDEVMEILKNPLKSETP